MTRGGCRIRMLAWAAVFRLPVQALQLTYSCLLVRHGADPDRDPHGKILDLCLSCNAHRSYGCRGDVAGSLRYLRSGSQLESDGAVERWKWGEGLSPASHTRKASCQ